MVPIPCIEDSLLLSLRDRSGLVEWRLSGWKSIVLLGVPFCLAQITMRWHHVTGSPTPSLTSLSRPALTVSCQWRGTGIGEWCAVGVAFGSIISLIGGLSIRGRDTHIMLLKLPIMLCSNSQYQANLCLIFTPIMPVDITLCFIFLLWMLYLFLDSSDSSDSSIDSVTDSVLRTDELRLPLAISIMLTDSKMLTKHYLYSILT